MAIKINPRNMFDFYVPPGGLAKIADHFAKRNNPAVPSGSFSQVNAPGQAPASTSSNISSPAPGNVGASTIKGRGSILKKILIVGGITIASYGLIYFYKTYIIPKNKNKDEKS